MANLRQKTWGIFIKPYFEYGGDKLVHRGSVSAPHPCIRVENGPSFISLKEGEAYMLYDTKTSFVEVRKTVKKIMDELGYSKKDILVTEIIPVDHIITPLV